MTIKKTTDGGRPPSTARPASTPAATPTRSTSAPPRTSAPASTSPPRGDETRLTAARRTRASLDRDPAQTEQNPVAAREVTQAQARTSRALTGDAGGSSAFDFGSDSDTSTSGTGAPRASYVGSPDSIDRASTAQSDEPAADLTFADDPLHEEENVDLHPPDAVAAPPPGPPDLSGLTPTETQTYEGSRGPDGPIVGGTRETFERDGVTYNRTTNDNGEVIVSYQQDGVNYSSTTRADGSSTNFSSQSGDNGTYTHSVDLGPDGQPLRDETTSNAGAVDPETGEYTSQSRSVVVTPDGRTTTEHTRRPDGTQTNLTRSQRPDGTLVEETYNYTGDNESLSRTTTGAPDGSQQSRTERTYQSDVPIEQLAEGAPAIPTVAGAPNTRYGEDPPTPLVGDFPADGRGPTSVSEVETTVTSAPTAAHPGVTTTTSDLTTYSQTSSDVGIQEHLPLPTGTRGPGPNPLGTWPNSTFPNGVSSNPDETNVTRTITVGQTLGPNGEMVDVTQGSETLVVSGTRDSDGSEVSTTVTNSWDGSGASSTTTSSTGYTRDEQSQGQTYLAGPSVTVGGRTVGLRPTVDGKWPDSHLRDKGGTEVENFLGVDYDEPVDTSVTVTRDATGHTVSETFTMSNVDEQGDGHSVSRVSTPDGTAWVYNATSNDGQDFDRQTVFEGSNATSYESHHVTGDGTFVNTNSVIDGEGQLVSSGEVRREEISADQLDSYVTEGGLTQAQADQMRREGPPYYLEYAMSHTEQSGDEPSQDFESSTYTSGTGYAVGYSRNSELNFDTGEGSLTTFNTTYDPDASVPFHGELTQQSRNPDTGVYTTTDSGPLEVGRNGSITFDGQEVLASGQIPQGAGGEAPGIKEINSYLGLAGDGISKNLERGAEAAGEVFVESPALTRLGQFTGLIGAVGGVATIVSAEGDPGQILAGSASITQGGAILAETIAAAGGAGTAAASTVATGAAKAAKILGPVAAGLEGLAGAYQVFNGETGYDRAAGAISVAAAGAAFIPVVGWIASIGLGIIAFAVGNGDAHNTAGIDQQFFESGGASSSASGSGSW